MNEDKIKLALGILSGRIQSLSTLDYETLGYDTYKFNAFGKPDSFEIKLESENIITEALLDK